MNLEFILDSIISERYEEFKESFDEEIMVLRNNHEWIEYWENLIKLNEKLDNDCNSILSYVVGITDDKPDIDNLPFFMSHDFPDVDSDFSDKFRPRVVKYIEKAYGESKVKTISNLTLFKPKSAIGEFAKALKIPEWEVEAAKDSILERAGGDNRASFCIEDTFRDTDAGKALIEKYPEIGLVKYIEMHPKQKGKHAAGVIICNEDLTNYAGVDNRTGTIHMNKDDAEKINLLKVDILGLRTLSVLEDAAKLIGMDYKDFYKIDLEDEGIYKTYKKQALSGVFQFEGDTMKRLNQEVPMETFNDVAAAQALARPGALTSGGTGKYIDSKLGRKEPVYYSDVHKEITESTFGIIVFQESMMAVAKHIANFGWEDVGKMRKAASKSYGDEYFETFKEPFINQCQSYGGLTEDDAKILWSDIASSGSYSFNAAHAYSYSVISNWCAWFKNYYGLEFVAAILNNSKSDKDSLKVLREFYLNEGLEYEDVNPDSSEVKWSIVDGKLIGGLSNINGFGVRKAQEALDMRLGKKKFTKSILNTMFDPITPYRLLFQTDFHWWKIYDDPYSYTGESLPISYLEDVHNKGEYWVIGQLLYHDDIDLNSFSIKEKRGGKEITDGFDRKMVFRLEDDTDTLTMIVSRFDYESLKPIIMNSKVDRDFLLVKGEVIFPDSRIFMAKKAANLNDQIGLEVYDKRFSKTRRAKKWIK